LVTTRSRAQTEQWIEQDRVREQAQQDINTFGTFQELVDKFLEMFQVKIDHTEVPKEYYSLQ
jgi:hypothetical protein